MPAHSDHATQDASVSKGGKLHIWDTYTLFPFGTPHTQTARHALRPTTQGPKTSSADCPAHFLLMVGKHLPLMSGC